MDTKPEVDAEIKIKLVKNGYILKSGADWNVYTDPEKLIADVRSMIFSLGKSKWK